MVWRKLIYKEGCRRREGAEFKKLSSIEGGRASRR
jgi:hypothetical protein